jgi:ferritin-like metal-binding protein YciE
MANAQAMMRAMAGDEILKNTFANNACENFEIAAYKSMLALCKQAGVDLSLPLEEMAQWVDSHVEGITLQYLQKEEQPATA